MLTVNCLLEPRAAATLSSPGTHGRLIFLSKDTQGIVTCVELNLDDDTSKHMYHIDLQH